MDINPNSNKGFTLLEVLISSIMVMFIIIAFYSLIISTQHSQITEENKTNMNQAIRAIDQLLCENIRNAGSIFSLLNTPTFLGTPSPFTGIYPLNKKNYPDGIILASGDYLGVTELTSDFVPGNTTISVKSVANPNDTSISAWTKNDIGVVLRADGYYIFKVSGDVTHNDTFLTLRATPVYYSGLLNIPQKYKDLSITHLGSAGNTSSYSSGAPVIRLNYFSMFLTKTENDGSKTLTLTTDTEGVANIFADGMETASRAIPIVPDLEDLQFEYITKDLPPELWASASTDFTSYSDPCATPTSTDCVNFIQNFTTKNISSIRVSVLLKTEDKHRGEHVGEGGGLIGQGYNKPRMGDTLAKYLPTGRFHYTYLTYEIMIRNFNIIY